jgi:DNA repair exonuclease SbcCD ATPase subunit
MSYKTFVSAVLLRQGEADAFLKTEPAQRKSRLLELLDLQFYEKLGEAANSRYNDYRKETKRRQEELVCLPKISNEELATQRQIITEAEETLSRVKQILTVKDAALADARRAANLIAEIAQKEKQQQADADLIEKANIIFAAARRYRDLSSNLPLLNNLWMVRHRLFDEVESIKTTNQLIIGLQDEQESSPQLLTAKQDESAACTALAEAEAHWHKRRDCQQELILQVKQLQEIESLEQKFAKQNKT